MNGYNKPLEMIDDVRADVEEYLRTYQELLFNERDLQMHLALHLLKTGHYADVDLEYCIPSTDVPDYRAIWKNEQLRIDTVVRIDDEYLPIELKYKTKSVKKRIPRFGEQVSSDVEVMKNQGAQDLGKYDFWKDVRRIEIVRKRFKAIKSGLAVFVTNDPAYLQSGRDLSNHIKFSMTEGSHGKEKHWLDKESTCCKTHPDFDVDQVYSIHWGSKTIEDITIYYTLLTI